MKISANAVGICTRYKFVSVNPKTLKETELSGWSPNVLLTSGRNVLATQNGWYNACQVGTDNTAANASQTALLGYVAGTSTVLENSFGAESAAPYYGWRRKRFRFGLGEAAANLNEVGIGWSTSSGDTIVARARIVDTDGNETTVTPLADEYLDVYTEVRYYPPLSDSTGTVVLNGVTYDYIVRASAVTSASAWGEFIGNNIASLATSVLDWRAYDDDAGTITQFPSGVAYDSDNHADYTDAYVNNSYQITFGMNVGPNGWNATTGKLVRSISIRTTAGRYQVQFDSQSNPGFGVPKTTDFTMAIQLVLGWDEAVIP